MASDGTNRKGKLGAWGKKQSAAAKRNPKKS